MKFNELAKVIPNFQECNITIYKEKRIVSHFNCKINELDMTSFYDLKVKFVSSYMTCDYDCILTITLEAQYEN